MSEKFFLKSLTIWGAIVGFLPSLLVLFGEDADTGDVEAIRTAGEGVIRAAWTLFDAVNEAIGALMVVVGRFRAKTPVTAKVKKS